MDAVFRALADPTRRLLLDLLKAREPLTLGQLVDGAGEGSDGEPMTRFGVMKHLGVLEEAGLVTTRKSGREKLHYLNAAPIQLVADRWISRFAKPLVQRLADVKTIAERETKAMPNQSPRQVYEVFIKASPERIWAALTQPEMTEHYYYQSRIESSLKPGAPFRYLVTGDHPVMVDGVVIEAHPPKKLVTTFAAQWAPENAKDRPSRVTYEITPMEGFCKLTLVHDDFDGETETFRNVAQGWPMIVSGLKTLLETGKPLSHAA
jgi:uncharacterized protein YndB with AHSA1/START domain/DNA-binding transcriptional ArsR family regulator